MYLKQVYTIQNKYLLEYKNMLCVLVREYELNMALNISYNLYEIYDDINICLGMLLNTEDVSFGNKTVITLFNKLKDRELMQLLALSEINAKFIFINIEEDIKGIKVIDRGKSLGLFYEKEFLDIEEISHYNHQNVVPIDYLKELVIQSEIPNVNIDLYRKWMKESMDILIYFKDNQPIAIVSLINEPIKCINYLYCKNEYRGNGIAKKLLTNTSIFSGVKLAITSEDKTKIYKGSGFKELGSWCIWKV